MLKEQLEEEIDGLFQSYQRQHPTENLTFHSTDFESKI